MARFPRGMKVLVAGSDSELLNRLERLFIDGADKGRSTYSFSVQSASDTTRALTLFRTNHPDLVMLHLSLGAKECQEACKKIRELEGQRHTGIIFLSDPDEISEQALVEFLEIGGDDFAKTDCSDREILARSNAVLKLKAMTDELRSANHKLHRLSYTDELTGLNNMRAFNGQYSRAVRDVLKGQNGIGVIMLDLDNFKLVNDSTNHLMGSHVISEVGKLIRGSGALGEDDCAARFGGDEYVIFTIDDDLASVEKKGEAIRRVIKNGVFMKDGKTIKITTSVGVSFTISGYRGKAEDPIKAADMMLYKSKAEGRDKISSIELTDPSALDELTNTENIEEKKLRESG